MSALPAWFAEPSAGPPSGQLSLFARPIEEVLFELRVSMDELRRWKARGWIGFDAHKGRKCSDEETAQIELVRGVVRSGLPDAQVRILLDQLPRPCWSDPRRLTYSFVFGWVEGIPPATIEEVLDEHADAWLESLASEGELERLKQLGKRIAELVEEQADEPTSPH